MEPLTQDYYSVEEVAALCGCHEKHIHRMVKRGELPADPHGKPYRFHRADVENFLNRCERTGSWPQDRK